MNDTYGCIPMDLVIAIKELAQMGNGEGNIRLSAYSQVHERADQGAIQYLHQFQRICIRQRGIRRGGTLKALHDRWIHWGGNGISVGLAKLLDNAVNKSGLGNRNKMVSPITSDSDANTETSLTKVRYGPKGLELLLE